MTNSSNSLLHIAQLMLKLNQDSSTGTLTLTAGMRKWTFFFTGGVLNYAIDEQHRVRRWQRLVTRHNLNMIVLTNAPICYKPWEYVLLCRGIRDGQIRVDQARQAIAQVVEEVLFIATSEPEVKSHWDGSRKAQIALSSTVAQVGLELEPLQRVLKNVRNLQGLWADINLPHDYVNRGIGLTPSAKDSSAKESTLLSLGALLNGTRSFWDVAQTLNQSSLAAARMVKHFVGRNILSFDMLADLPQPPELKLMQAASATQGLGQSGIMSQAGLTIACIDDSPSILNQMDSILSGAGCRSVGIREPIQALPTLLNAQPDLIFLDLIMPVVTGYELCAQIRRVSALKDVPVVILTSNDGAFDRVRANLAGATDFLSKPVEIERIMDVLKKYANRKTNIAPSAKVYIDRLDRSFFNQPIAKMPR